MNVIRLIRHGEPNVSHAQARAARNGLDLAVA